MGGNEDKSDWIGKSFPGTAQMISHMYSTVPCLIMICLVTNIKVTLTFLKEMEAVRR